LTALVDAQPEFAVGGAGGGQLDVALFQLKP
jgi:hypothetical protein